MRIRRPQLFCNPLNKNGEGIIDDVSHLTCYKIDVVDDDDSSDDDDDSSDGAARLVDIFNQLDDQTLVVEEPQLLCVPTEKLSVEVVIGGDDDDDDDDD